MKYKIKPYGCSKWMVYCGSFPRTLVLKKTTHGNYFTYEWTWFGLVSEDWIYQYIFNSVDAAKEAIKTSIIQHGISKAHDIQHKKRMKLHAKEKPIIVPPWK
jgi:hypothetical protein